MVINDLGFHFNALAKAMNLPPDAAIVSVQPDPRLPQCYVRIVSSEKAREAKVDDLADVGTLFRPEPQVQGQAQAKPSADVVLRNAQGEVISP